MPKRKRMDDFSDIHRILKSFQNLSEPHQDLFLSDLLGKCSKKQLCFMSSIITPQLKVDVLRHLPSEISLHVLSYLPVESLCRLSCVSKFHRSLVEDSYLWRQLCQTHDYQVPSFRRPTYPFTQKELRVLSDCPSPPRSASVCYDQMDISDASWSFKDYFKHQYVLRKNWTNGNCAHFSIEGPQFAIVTCLQFNEEILVIATDNSSYGTIEVFDARHGKKIRKLTGHEGGVWAMEFSGNTMVTGGCDRDLRVWDLSTGVCKFRLRGHTSTVRCLRMISDEIVVTGSRDNTIRIWNINTGTCLSVLEGHTASVRCLASHGNIVVSGSYDNTLRVWDIQSGHCLHVLNEHQAQIYSVAFDGSIICSGSLDADVRVWDVNSGECLWTLEGHDALVGHMQLTKDTLVTGGSDGRVCVWDVKTGELKIRITAHRNSVSTLQFDETRILTGGEDGLKMWDLKTGSFIRYLIQSVTGVWRLSFNDMKLVSAIQRGEGTSIEIMDYSPKLE